MVNHYDIRVPHLLTEKHLVNRVTAWFLPCTSKSDGFYRTGIERLPGRWQKVLESNGYYVTDWKHICLKKYDFLIFLEKRYEFFGWPNILERLEMERLMLKNIKTKEICTNKKFISWIINYNFYLFTVHVHGRFFIIFFIYVVFICS